MTEATMIPPAVPAPNAVIVKNFLNRDSPRTVEAGEFMNFWKGCSTDERNEFAEGARRT